MRKKIMTKTVKICLTTVLLILISFIAFNHNVSYSQILPTSITTPANEKAKEVISPEEKIAIKRPVIINGETILYAGGTEDLFLRQRTLDIKTSIESAINKALLSDSIDTEINEQNNGYTLSINNQQVVTVTEIDSKVNNIEMHRLARVWKSNIVKLIHEAKKHNKGQKPKDIYKELAISLLLFLIILALIELFRIKFNKLLILMAAKLIKNFGKILHKITKPEENNEYPLPQEDTTTAKFTKEGLIEETGGEQLEEPLEEIIEKEKCIKKDCEEKMQEKLTVITNEISSIFNILSRIMQVIAVFVFANYTLYTLPQTTAYVSEFTHFAMSVFDIIQELLSEWLLAENTWESFGRIIIIALTTSIIVYVLRIFGSGLENIIMVLLEEEKGRAKRIQTITKIVRTTINILLIILACVLILSELGLNITPIIAGAGIFGLAISFGAQSLVKDLINGLFILIENQFGIGDVVSIDGIGGVVEDMSLRKTTLRDLSGKAYIIPNGQISTVTVLTKEWARAHLDISIAYKEDIDTAIVIMKEVADQMQRDFSDKITEEPQVLGVNELADSSVNIKLIMKTVAGEQWFIEREYRRRIKYAFDSRNIEIPYPHQTVYMPQNIGYESKN